MKTIYLLLVIVTLSACTSPQVTVTSEVTVTCGVGVEQATRNNKNKFIKYFFINIQFLKLYNFVKHLYQVLCLSLHLLVR